VDPEILSEYPPAVSIDLDGLTATPTSVKGQHQLAEQTLPGRIGDDQGLQLFHQTVVTPQIQIALDSVLQGCDVKLV
jgi:hypothetical protein